MRFEAVDAPELHYGTAAQRLGDKARDNSSNGWALRISSIIKHDSDGTVMPILILCAGLFFQRLQKPTVVPVSYVLLEKMQLFLTMETGSRWMTDLLKKTINYRLLDEGIAYYTVYTSTPFNHRKLLRDVASQARNANRGVWELDMTTEFALENQDSIGPDGQLILPKLFRRCTDYLKDVDKGFQGNLLTG